MADPKKKSATNFQNWRITQKHIRIEHNKAVVGWFRVANNQSRQNLRNSILIYKKDTANQILVKIQFFANYIARRQDETLSLPLQYNTRVLPNISQLAIIFRAVDKGNKSGNYTLHIPHYNGNPSPNISGHTKGNHWAKITCKDGASIMVYCNVKAQAEQLTREMVRYVEKKYKPDVIRPATGYMAHEPNKIVKVKPIRADYYAEGKKNQTVPTWRHYY